MTTLGPADLLVKSVSSGIARTQQRPLSTLGLTVLAGAYIALGGFLAIRCGLALPWDVWGSFGKFVFAAVFPVGLMLVVLCGADLFTGNCMTLASAIYRKEITGTQAFLSGLWAWLGNFIGALFVAYCMVYASGLIFDSVTQNGTTTMPWANSLVALANSKTHLSFDAAFWRAVGCNWLVCIAVYASFAVKDGAGKIMALWFPTMAFVAMGMEHCVANMFFVPAAIFAGNDPRYLALVESGDAVALTATWSNFFVDNLIPVTLGNIVGGAVLVAGIYTLIHGKATRA